MGLGQTFFLSMSSGVTFTTNPNVFDDERISRSDFSNKQRNRRPLPLSLHFQNLLHPR